jgi:hypothetical protein
MSKGASIFHQLQRTASSGALKNSQANSGSVGAAARGGAGERVALRAPRTRPGSCSTEASRLALAVAASARGSCWLGGGGATSVRAGGGWAAATDGVGGASSEASGGRRAGDRAIWHSASWSCAVLSSRFRRVLFPPPSSYPNVPPTPSNSRRRWTTRALARHVQSACDALTGLGSARGASAAAYPSCACASRLVTLCLLLLGRGLRLGWSRPWPVARCLAGPESVLWPRASVAGFALRRRRGLVATASASSRCRVGSCGACMCWCMQSTCEVSYVQGAVMGARFNVRGL